MRLNKNILRIIKLVYTNIYHSTLIRWLVRKPINTWILPKLSNPQQEIKDAYIWNDEKIHKRNAYSSISHEYEKLFINYVLSATIKHDHILDICCNEGRWLKALRRNGYKNLSGFDIMEPAIEKFKLSKEYLSGGIEVEHSLAQDYLLRSHENSYDYAITWGATIELIHPSFLLFEVLNKITRKGFIFIINENKHTYPRFYRHIIRSSGFTPKKILSLSPDFTLLHYEK